MARRDAPISQLATALASTTTAPMNHFAALLTGPILAYRAASARLREPYPTGRARCRAFVRGALGGLRRRWEHPSARHFFERGVAPGPHHLAVGEGQFTSLGEGDEHSDNELHPASRFGG